MNAFYQIIRFFLFAWDFQPGDIIERTTRVAILPSIFSRPHIFLLLSSTVMKVIYYETCSAVLCYAINIWVICKHLLLLLRWECYKSVRWRLQCCARRGCYTSTNLCRSFETRRLLLMTSKTKLAGDLFYYCERYQCNVSWFFFLLGVQMIVFRTQHNKSRE